MAAPHIDTVAVDGLQHVTTLACAVRAWHEQSVECDLEPAQITPPNMLCLPWQTQCGAACGVG
jgi:hypothetical protein